MNDKNTWPIDDVVALEETPTKSEKKRKSGTMMLSSSQQSQSFGLHLGAMIASNSFTSPLLFGSVLDGGGGRNQFKPSLKAVAKVAVVPGQSLATNRTAQSQHQDTNRIQQSNNNLVQRIRMSNRAMINNKDAIEELDSDRAGRSSSNQPHEEWDKETISLASHHDGLEEEKEDFEIVECDVKQHKNNTEDMIESSKKTVRMLQDAAEELEALVIKAAATVPKAIQEALHVNLEAVQKSTNLISYLLSQANVNSKPKGRKKLKS